MSNKKKLLIGKTFDRLLDIQDGLEASYYLSIMQNIDADKLLPSIVWVNNRLLSDLKLVIKDARLILK